ncbi:MAG: transcription elongation factor GreA [Gammaproteobacteria bacterium]|nr:transcription elongation factor GreA [Gammaproteobacteria bacterium]
MQTIPMTIQGAEALRMELGELKKQRLKISKAIAEARELGDLKENAEYHAAREQQGLAEARVRDIEDKLSIAQVIDISKITNKDIIVFGATAHLINTSNDEEIRYQIVGEEEADLNIGKISINSPIARALIGKQIDDIAAVTTPSGVIEYEITKIEYI